MSEVLPTSRCVLSRLALMCSLFRIPNRQDWLRVVRKRWKVQKRKKGNEARWNTSRILLTPKETNLPPSEERPSEHQAIELAFLRILTKITLSVRGLSQRALGKAGGEPVRAPCFANFRKYQNAPRKSTTGCAVHCFISNALEGAPRPSKRIQNGKRFGFNNGTLPANQSDKMGSTALLPFGSKVVGFCGPHLRAAFRHHFSHAAGGH